MVPFDASFWRHPLVLHPHPPIGTTSDLACFRVVVVGFHLGACIAPRSFPSYPAASFYPGKRPTAVRLSMAGAGTGVRPRGGILYPGYHCMLLPFVCITLPVPCTATHSLHFLFTHGD